MERIIEFTLHIRAATQNTFWGHRPPRGMKYITKAGRQWRADVQWLTKIAMKTQSIKPFTTERLSITYWFYFKTKRKRDTFNYEKPLTDSLEGLLFDNDEQVDEGHVYRYYDCEEDKIEILITPLL